MNRVRISTTVNGITLEAARKQLGLRDADLFDRALKAVLRESLIAAELVALERHPYESDPELRMPEPRRSPLQTDDTANQKVPARVQKLAQRKRALRRATTAK